MAERPDLEDQLAKMRIDDGVETEAKTLKDLVPHCVNFKHPEDTNCFYETQYQDGQTVVMLFQVILTKKSNSKKIYHCDMTRTKDGKHAEKLAIENITTWVTAKLDWESYTGIKLIAMATTNPRTVYMTALTKMLEEWKNYVLSVDYTLHIAKLYHKGGETTPEAIERLQMWKKELEDAGIVFKLQHISVCDELEGCKIRDIKSMADWQDPVETLKDQLAKVMIDDGKKSRKKPWCNCKKIGCVDDRCGCKKNKTPCCPACKCIDCTNHGPTCTCAGCTIPS